MPATADYLAWSGHKMYAPFGAGVLVGPRSTFAEGDPFLAGGGAVDLVDLDEVVWTDPPDREEAGSPNVLGAVALDAAIGELLAIGWPAIAAHDHEIRTALRAGLARIPGLRLLGPPATTDTLALATFVVEGIPHALVAARLSAEFGIGVRHGCFCAHPYLLRLLGLSPAEVVAYREAVLAGIAGRSPAPCGPAPASRPRWMTSTASSRRSRPSPAATLRRRVPPGPRHRRLLAGHRPARLDGRGAKRRSALRSRVTTHALAASRAVTRDVPPKSVIATGSCWGATGGGQYVTLGRQGKDLRPC